MNNWRDLLIATIGLRRGQFLDYMTQKLDQRECVVLSKRFGIDFPKQTLEEVGISFGITRERIRQVENRAIRKLSHGIEKILVPKVAEENKNLIEEIAQLRRQLSMSELQLKDVIKNSNIDKDLYGCRITTLGLSTRVENLLKRAGFLTVQELERTSDSDFLRLRGIGPKTLRDIRLAVKKWKKDKDE